MIFSDLITDYEANEYKTDIVKIFLNYFQNVTDKNAIEQGVQFFVDNAEKLFQQKVLSDKDLLLIFEAIRTTLMNKIILRGELPSVHFCQLYQVLILQTIEFPKDEILLFFRKQFFHLFISLSSRQNEKYIYNALIFLLDLLSLPTSEALELFLERSICIDAVHFVDFKEANFLGEFLTKNAVDIHTLFSPVKKILNLEYFDSLSKDQQRSVFAWLLNVIWPIPMYLNNPKWLELYTPVKNLIQHVIEQKDVSTQMYLHFFLYHICGNNYQTHEEWGVFNDEIERPASKLYKKYANDNALPLCKSNISKNTKVKIALVRDRVVENSPYKVEYSLLSALMSHKIFTEKYELYYVSMQYIDKAIDQPHEIEKIEKLGVKYVAPGNTLHSNEGFYDHLKKALLIREWFLENEIDIMVGTVSGYDIMNFLFSTRVAPRQVFWSHGNYNYHIDGIDQKIFHYSKENEVMNLCGYQYRSFKIPHKIDMFDQHVEMEIVTREREQYPKDVVVLGTIGRLVKVDSEEYIKTVCTIMTNNSKTIYIAAGVGNVDSIKAKIPLELLDRFYFPGFVNPHLYGYIIDIFLDTFPLRQGTSFTEFHVKDGGKAAILMDFDTGSGDMWSDWFRQFTKNAKLMPAATTLEEYIQKASDVITNEILRKEVGQMLHYSTEMFLCSENDLNFVDAVLGH